jgi:signal transduction histidine kinase
MHLINHKVKGSFTHSKYIFAGLLDGMFGEISPEVKKIAQAGLDSDTMGIRTIDLILNAANLESGTIKYDMQPVDLKDVVQKIVEEKKLSIEEKGIKLETEFKDEKNMMLGDIFWLKEIFNNLLENAFRYTEHGNIVVGLEKQNGKILLSVKDTGIGLTEEDKKSLFTEGGRGKESVKFNVDSTGYGLYSVKLITEAHKGRVWAESKGKGEGSEFFVEFDAI